MVNPKLEQALREAGFTNNILEAAIDEKQDAVEILENLALQGHVRMVVPCFLSFVVVDLDRLNTASSCSLDSVQDAQLHARDVLLSETSTHSHSFPRSCFPKTHTDNSRLSRSPTRNPHTSQHYLHIHALVCVHNEPPLQTAHDGRKAAFFSNGRLVWDEQIWKEIQSKIRCDIPH